MGMVIWCYGDGDGNSDDEEDGANDEDGDDDHCHGVSQDVLRSSSVLPLLLLLLAQSSILKKDPEERLDLNGILSHPWTTEHGELDLLGDEGVDAYELADNARIQAYQEITELLSDFPKREFKDGEYLFLAGHDANTMYFIINGQVDIVLREKDRADLLPTQQVKSDSDEDDDSESEDEEDDMPNEQEDGLVAPGESSKSAYPPLSKTPSSICMPMTPDMPCGYSNCFRVMGLVLP